MVRCPYFDGSKNNDHFVVREIRINFPYIFYTFLRVPGRESLFPENGAIRGLVCILICVGLEIYLNRLEIPLNVFRDLSLIKYISKSFQIY